MADVTVESASFAMLSHWVKTDKAEVELRWSISIGKMQANQTIPGSIKIVRK